VVGPMVDRSTGIPLYLQVADRLERWIEFERLGPGAALPPEAQLQKRYGVSRVTVRSALTLLERRGRIERHQGRGTFVSLPTMERDLIELTSFTEHLASKGLASSSRLVEYERLPHRAVGGRSTDPVSPDAPDPDLFPGNDGLVRVVRLRLANEAPIGLHNTLVPLQIAERIGFTEERLRSDPTTSLYACLELGGHLLGRAEEHLRARALAAREARLLGVSAGTAAMSVLRLTRDRRDALVEAVRAVYLGNKYDYVITMERSTEIVPKGG
jgi:GntR family transcriptional regulator